MFAGFQIPLTPPVIAAIVVGCLFVLGVLFCVVGATVDCFVHMHKYWCGCAKKACHDRTNGGRELSTFPHQSPRPVHHLEAPPPPQSDLRPPPNAPPLQTEVVQSKDSRVMLVRAVPPHYSTFTVACEHCHNTVQQRYSLNSTQLIGNINSVNGRVHDRQNGNGETVSQDGRVRSSFSAAGNQPIPLTPASSHSVPANLTMVPGLNNNNAATLTNTASGEQYRILVPASTAHASASTSPSTQQRSIPRMPPSYSSIFRAGCAVLISEDTGETYIATKDDVTHYE